MPRVSIGGNQFEKVALPLVLDDRYFLLEEDDGKDLWTVFTLVKGEPFVEILRNQPQEDSLSVVETNPNGMITVSDSETGPFLYKIRPGLKCSSIFAAINGEETEIQVFDSEIRVGTNVFSNDEFMGFPVGIRVRGGSMGTAAGLPPEFQRLIQG